MNKEIDARTKEINDARLLGRLEGLRESELVVSDCFQKFGYPECIRAILTYLCEHTGRLDELHEYIASLTKQTEKEASEGEKKE